MTSRVCSLYGARLRLLRLVRPKKYEIAGRDSYSEYLVVLQKRKAWTIPPREYLDRATRFTFSRGSSKASLIGALLRSIAEPSGTDKAVTLGLALAHRADSIVGHGHGKS